MKLYLNEKIKKLRLDNNWTQEQLASMLEVSTQAVSRWETNSTFPDIELLPDIASIFQTSVDELLGINDSINNNRVEKCLEKANSHYSTGDIERMVEVLELGIKENPTNIKLSLRLIEALFSFYNDNRDKTCERILNIGNKIINRIKNVEDKLLLYQIMSYTYLEQNNIEQAKVFAEKLPSISFSKEFILSSIKTGTERDKLIQHNIQVLLTNLTIQIEKLAHSKNYTPEEKTNILNKLNSIFEIMYENKDYGYENYLLKNINMDIFNILKVHKIEKACNYLVKALNYAKKFDDLNDKVVHNSLLNNKTIFDKSKEFGKDYIESEVDTIINSLKTDGIWENEIIQNSLARIV